MENNRLYSTLTWAGALPFVACAILPWFGIDLIPNIGSPAYVAQSYGLAIASFLSGAHWGTYLFNRTESPTNLFLTSNAVVIAIWFAFLLNIAQVGLFVLVLAFLYLLFIDYRLFRAGLLSRYYFNLRRNVTALVVVCLVSNIAGS